MVSHRLETTILSHFSSSCFVRPGQKQLVFSCPTPNARCVLEIPSAAPAGTGAPHAAGRECPSLSRNLTCSSSSCWANGGPVSSAQSTSPQCWVRGRRPAAAALTCMTHSCGTRVLCHDWYRHRQLVPGGRVVCLGVQINTCSNTGCSPLCPDS